MAREMAQGLKVLGALAQDLLQFLVPTPGIL